MHAHNNYILIRRFTCTEGLLERVTNMFVKARFLAFPALHSQNICRNRVNLVKIITDGSRTVNCRSTLREYIVISFLHFGDWSELNPRSVDRVVTEGFATYIRLSSSGGLRYILHIL
jgi:hypothetical protein